MKEFGRKHKHKIYIGGATIAVIILIPVLVSMLVPSFSSVSSTSTDALRSVQGLVQESDIHFQKDAQGIYDAYTPEKLSLASDHKVVLFFKADWCPSCRTADETLNKEFASIPKDIAILKVSFDTDLELRRKYGVTIQHTFVQVDSQGNLITKWIGGNSIAEILKNIR